MNAELRAPPPAQWLGRLRLICLELPEAREERAWVGIRWTVRQKNFAHIVAIAGGRPPAYARAAGVDDACVCTFRLEEAQCAAERYRLLAPAKLAAQLE